MRWGLTGSADSIARAPSVSHQFGDILLGALSPARVLILLEERQEGRERLLAITDQAVFHWVAQREVGAIDIDLDAPRVPRLGCRNSL